MPKLPTATDTNRMQALSESYVTHRPSLLSFLTRRLGSAAKAEDVTQEAFLRFVQTEDVRNPKAFLYHAARNIVTSLGRSDRYQARISEYADLFFEDTNFVTPERAILAADELERINIAIAHLPPVCAKVFHMYKVEGLPQKEIARRLGISVTAVEKSMRRAMSRLLAAANGAEKEREHAQE
jgi:RNA polymerase sigma factor (sigma-70 family)